MAIKEYKLKDICNFKTGIDPLPNEKNGNIPFIKLGNTNNYEINYDDAERIKTTRKKVLKKGDLILCWSCSVGKSFLIKKNCFFSTAFYKIEKIKDVFYNSYLHYYFVKNEYEISQLSVGSVLKKANMDILGNYKINLPSLEVQQSIINIIEPKEELFLKYHEVVDISDIDKFKSSWDNLINIIEPFEKINNNIKFKKEQISKILSFEIDKSKPIDTMVRNEIIFEKGRNINSKDIVNRVTDLPFINVSAINNKINKFVSNYNVKKNVSYGDVVLSLDGTIGLVNNFLEGYNGYGYKVYSKHNNIDKSIIYYSLLNPINQKIILENSSGSVIKHATKSKDKILLFDFKNRDLIKTIFKYEIQLKKIEKLVNIIIEKLITLFII